MSQPDPAALPRPSAAIDPPLPKGSVDTHFHIFPAYPLASPRPFTPAPFPNETAASFHASIGVERAVLVHSMAYGFDLSSLTDYVAEAGVAGVGALKPSDTAEEIRKLDAAGVRGVRAVFGPEVTTPARARGILHLAARLEAAGVVWSVLVQEWDAAIFDEILALADDIPASQALVVDHLGYLQGPWSSFPSSPGATITLSAPHLAPLPADTPGLQSLLALLKSYNVYVKLSAPYRVTEKPETLEHLVKAYAATPDKLIWGSDWPYVPLAHDIARWKAQGKGDVPTGFRSEDLGEWVGLLRSWLGEDVFTQALVTNAQKLYG
ncbi:hypothetical protein Q8F55_003138 [Vanrija albida]|uniref:Amidohydrolase-related domain-containing protein n=1 Tax=Vanrija albida TaxID=181172 RepID=A0ABR3QBN7_9TREE